MNFSISTNNLKKAVASLVLTLDGESNTDSLRCYRLQYDGRELTIASTTMQTSTVCTCRCFDILESEKGSILVNGQLLTKIIEHAIDPQLDFRTEAKEMFVRIDVGRDCFRVKYFVADDFPALPEWPSATPPIELHREVFIRLVEKAVHAMGENEQRKNLYGVCFRNGRTLTSDAHRMVIIEHDFQNLPEFIIPASDISTLTAMLKASRADIIECSVNPTQILFKIYDPPDDLIRSTYYAISFTGSRFPDESKVELKAEPSRLEIRLSRSEIAAALLRVAAVVDSKVPVVNLAVNKDQVILSTRDEFGNTASVSLAARAGEQWLPGTTYSSNFDVNLLYDGVCALDWDDETIYVNAEDNRQPMLLKMNRYKEIILAVEIILPTSQKRAK